ncbi:hypothetical protein QHH11_01230 [Aphanizomenon sp. PH219]|uniref:Uncharacterized protein n=1 Tax=Dolichospermum heterosporum TAC447 TaxID=747523 RepID=A0ABY5M1J0_9CYAN|nr:hypothetical protein [Dolichospermum heterosporum]MDK2408304.1 hypothetical protein [Aphanizomenon sp. 202]MDK2457773.1 hypothetical protein [Aphanizomenon sp. PH219]UUO16738.1 hypothetical protein NG743_06850 [Dolichospermum heterosporum TAC447]
MESMKIKTHIGNDKILKIELPDEFANEELEIVIVFQHIAEKSLQSATKTPEELGYSRRFLEEVIGSWEGEPIERPEQLYFEKREEIQSPIS